MWTIRQEQAETFRQHHLRKFEDEMVEHLAKFAPKHWKSICEQSGRQVIRLGIAQAKKYEFKMRGPVRFYIELMFMFGSDFDTDPQCSWASAVLNAANLDEAERSDRLYYRLRDYMLEVLGMDRQHEISALRRVLQIRMEEFTSSKANLQDSIIAGLRSTYRQKFEYVGAPVIHQLVSHSFKTAARFALTNPGGVGVIALTSFMLGHRCYADPIFPWVSGILLDRGQSDPRPRDERLLQTAKSFFADLITEMESRN